MSSQTPNLNLVLPVGTEKVSRQIINDNNTKIDTAVGLNSTAISNLNGSKYATVSDYNLLKTTEVFQARADANSLNPPDATSPGRWYALFVWAVGPYVTQIAHSVTNDRLFIRGYYNNTWTAWQELVTKSGIDTLAISGISSSHTINASSSSAVLYGRVFHLRLSFRTTSAVSAFGTIATLPASMRPISQFVGYMMDGNYDPVPFDITYNGALRIWKAASSGVDYSLDITYIVQ